MSRSQGPAPAPAWRVEAPTIVLIVAFYACLVALTWYWSSLPVWLTLPAAGYLTALYGSLQHEVIHGHPTRWRGLNEALVFPAFLIWIPFERYRDLHLRHHRNDRLTDPYDDPESFYLSPERWGALRPSIRALLRANNTLAGRLTIGPAVAAMRFWAEEAGRAMQGDSDVVRAWALHFAALAAAFAWMWWACGISPLVFAFAFAYPGTALILLRSYAEHRAHESIAARTAIVETGPVLALLFLNNNLHALHHARPGVPWYEMPGAYRAERDALLRDNECYLVAGYTRLFRKYFLSAKEPVPHPSPQRHRPLATKASAPWS